MSTDSTPDMAHIDQLVITLKYVEQKSCTIVERFLKFVPIYNHTGESLACTMMDILEKTSQLSIADCRGQSYDNAANMSGNYNGVQAHISKKTPLAMYSMCPVQHIH